MNPQSLREFLDGLVKDPKLFPVYSEDGKLLTTWCNLGAQRVAQFFDCKEFALPNARADGLYHWMASNLSGKWIKIDGDAATTRALRGELVFSALPSWVLGGGHGHIAAVMPLPMAKSASLGVLVPQVANIGAGRPDEPLVPLLGDPERKKTRSNWVCKTSQAYPVKWGHPNYYAWLPDAIAPFAG